MEEAIAISTPSSVRGPPTSESLHVSGVVAGPVGVGVQGVQDVPVARYAREHQLTRDYWEQPSSLLSTLSDLCAELADTARAADSLDDAPLPQLPTTSPCPLYEHLVLSRASLELIKRAVALQDGVVLSKLTLTPLPHRGRGLELELPLLETDHESDCRELSRQIQSRRFAAPHLELLPFEPLDCSKDEGLDFPQSSYRYNEELTIKAGSEKFNVPRHLFRYLNEQLAPDFGDEAARSASKEQQLVASKFRARRITPPLSPICRSDHPAFVPDPAICEVPICSDPVSLLEQDLKGITQEILRESLSPKIYPLTFPSPLAASPLQAAPKPRIRALRTDVPLWTDPSSSPPLVPDLVDLSKGLQLGVKPPAPMIDAEADCGVCLSDAAQAMFEDSAQRVMRTIQNERLSSVDAMARIAIPTLDFDIPRPAWAELPFDASAHYHWLRQEYPSTLIPYYSNLCPQSAAPKLQWTPFPFDQSRGFLEECIIDEAPRLQLYLDSFVKAPVPTSRDYVWKRPGIAILNSSNDVYEKDLELVQLAPQPESPEILADIKKSQAQHPETMEKLSPSAQSPLQAFCYQAVRARVAEARNSARQLLVDRSQQGATSILLSNFVDLHTKKRQKISQSSFFAKPVEPALRETPLSHDSSQISRTITTKAPQVTLAPFPQTDVSGKSFTLIFALTISRVIRLRLEKELPNSVIIERDFEYYNSTTWSGQSTRRLIVMSPLATEADVIVSPETGIVITTLLEVIQKPLPGCKGNAPIRERIEGVARRYEKLIILVMEEHKNEESVRSLVPSECQALAGFSGFVTSLDPDVQAYYIGGGDETVVKWILAFIAQNAPKADQVKDLLIQNETTWELFLRRAGMNAYAAQAVLALLHVLEDASEEQRLRSGLPGFVNMSAHERARKFAGILGGDKVLQRVSRVIDSRWSCHDGEDTTC